MALNIRGFCATTAVMTVLLTAAAVSAQKPGGILVMSHFRRQ